MHSDRRVILSLIAMGRITPSQAERLLATWPDEDDVILKAAVCFAVVWIVLPHLLEALTGFTHALASLPGVFRTAHHALACVACWFGGLS
jgi:hypothetical protein